MYAIDKCMGAYTWLAGDLQNWHDYYPKESPELLDTTVARLRTKAARSSSDILALFDSLHELLYEAVKERNLR